MFPDLVRADQDAITERNVVETAECFFPEAVAVKFVLDFAKYFGRASQPPNYSNAHAAASKILFLNLTLYATRMLRL